MMDKLIDWWDRLVYRFAYHSLDRRFRRHPGLAYLFELNLRGYREKNGLDEQTKSFIERVYRHDSEIRERIENDPITDLDEPEEPEPTAP